MVLTSDRMTQVFQRSHQAIADDRAAQVPNVHFLRKVRRRVVNDDRLGNRGGTDSESRVLVHPAQLRSEVV